MSVSVALDETLWPDGAREEATEVVVDVGVKDDVPVKEADVASRFGTGKTEVDSSDRECVPGVSAPVLLAVNV